MTFLSWNQQISKLGDKVVPHYRHFNPSCFELHCKFLNSKN
jgi:hypothetical protein